MFSGRINLKALKKAPRAIVKGLAIAFLIFLLFSMLQAWLLRYVDPPFSAFMLRDWLFSDADFSIKLNWASPEEISPHMARAVLVTEDQRFFEHRGLDWVEIELAWDEYKSGGRLRGASTISMQTARNMFLWSGRSWLRKGLEVYYTQLLEIFLPKTRILEIYLNVAQFGPGVFGVPAAARHFYKCSAKELQAGQAAALALVLPAPAKRSPLKPTPYLTSRKKRILKWMTWMPLPNWPIPGQESN